MAIKLQEIQERIAQAARAAGRGEKEITLLAATKTQDASTVREAIARGVKTVGENRVQELTEKLAQNAYEGVELHFIGHLQTNKVRQVAGQVALIHSVDSLRLAQEISRAMQRLAQENGTPRTQDVLIEVNIGGELSKGGVEPEGLKALLNDAAQLPAIRIAGLMCIPPRAESPEEARRYFARMKALFDRTAPYLSDGTPRVLSMGMSGDYAEAILEGATLVRVGTALFGPRLYL